MGVVTGMGSGPEIHSAGTPFFRFLGSIKP
jgi:hypothetical protein